MTEHATPEDDAKPEPPDSRRPYSPPKVVESTQFETLALSCGKLSAIACFPNPGSAS
jgi:hypothetical protein